MDSGRKKWWIICLIISMCLAFFRGVYTARENHRTYQNYTVVESETTKEAETYAEDQEEPVAAADRDSEESDSEEQDEKAAVVWEQPEEIRLSADGKGELISDKDAEALQHMKKYMVEGMSGNGASYPVYAPEGCEVSGGSLHYSDHGIIYFVSVIDGGDEEIPYGMMDMTMEGQQEDMEAGGNYSNVWVSETLENGEDRYAVVTAMDTDFSGAPCWIRQFIYLDVQQPGVGALWQMNVAEMQADEMTETILAQWGQCYGIGMERLAQKREENR